VLDKSIPYFNIIMKRSSDIEISNYPLPPGFSFELFSEGKEKKWAEIETSVGEFSTSEDALNYFNANYLPYLDNLKRRLLFVKNETGEEIGTITSWWNIKGNKRIPSIHWFAVKENYQGLGIGKALVSESLKTLSILEGNKAIFLHTQTWSYKAIGLYQKFGFEIVRDGTFGEYKNDYESAIPILRGLLKDRSVK